MIVQTSKFKVELSTIFTKWWDIKLKNPLKILVLSVFVSGLLSGGCEMVFEKVLVKGSKGR